MNIRVISTALVILLGAVIPGASVQAAAGTISGTIFRDYNGNGTQDINEPGIENVTVTAYDSAGATATATTVVGGTYNLAQVFTDNELRLEATLPLSLGFLEDGPSGPSTVQFVDTTAGNVAGVDFIFNNSHNYCQSNPNVLTSCFENGAGTGSTGPAFISYDFSLSGTADKLLSTSPVTSPSKLADIGEIGSVWGVAYHNEADAAFASSHLQRHVGMAGSTGAVYIVNNATGSFSGSFDLDGVVPVVGPTINLGSVDRATDADYTLPASSLTPSVDFDAYSKAAKISFGGISLTEDNDSLWLTNLNQRSLIQVDVSALESTTLGVFTPGTVNHYDIATTAGAPTCTNGNLRPWAIEFEDGKGYIGLVCDGETGAGVDVDGYILSFDPADITAGLTTELTWDFDYTREGNAGVWNPWSDDWADIDQNCGAVECFIKNPQPDYF